MCLKIVCSPNAGARAMHPLVSRGLVRAQVVHRHARHPAPARTENLFGAMDATNGHQNQTVIRDPLPTMSPGARRYPQRHPQTNLTPRGGLRSLLRPEGAAL